MPTAGQAYEARAPGVEDLIEDGDQPKRRDEEFGDPAEPGDLFTLSPPKLLKKLLQWWKANEDNYKRWEVEWEVNRRRREGAQNVYAEHLADRNQWKVYSPPGSRNIPASVLNKSDRLCQRVVSQVYVDPPVAEPVPSSGEDDDRDAAEFAGRVLIDIQSEAHLNDLDAQRGALDLASTTRSSFIHYYVDEKAGGRQPLEVMAAPEAQHVDEALVDPLISMPWPSSPVIRYVAQDGTLTDKPEDAALRWVRALRRELLHPKAIRLIPWTANDIWEAHGVIMARYMPLREAILRYEMEDMDEAAQEKTTGVRSEELKKLLPQRGGKPHDPDTPDKQDRLVQVVECYYKESPQYPDGAHIVIVGGFQVPTRKPWIGKRLGKREPMDLPVVQHRQFRGEMGDPHGRGLMDFLGTGNEARAHLIGVIEDVLDKNANRKTYIPTNSILQSKAHLLPFMTYVPINPGGEPKTEDLIPVPQEAINLYEIVNKEMDDASGLQEAGQGLNSPNVKSGRQALTIVSQVHAGLSDLKQNAERAFVRSCRIQLQLVGNSFTDPQILRFQGPDGSYKVKRWMGSDLGSSRDVRIKPGTMTMMSPLQKTQIALQYSQYGMLPPDELKDVITANIGGTIGLQDDPHLQRVRRQIEAWRKGPPADFPEEPQIDPMTGMQASLPLESTLQPVPADAIPTVAQLRLREIGKEMASTRFTNAKPLWQGVLTDLFVQAQTALQPPPQAPPGVPGEEKKPPEDVGTQKPEATQGQPPELQQGEADVLPEVV